MRAISAEQELPPAFNCRKIPKELRRWKAVDAGSQARVASVREVYRRSSVAHLECIFFDFFREQVFLTQTRI
jgi:hypothetical protein